MSHDSIEARNFKEKFIRFSKPFPKVSLKGFTLNGQFSFPDVSIAVLNRSLNPALRHAIPSDQEKALQATKLSAMSDKILITLDGSEFAERAFPVGLGLAKANSLKVHLLLAVSREEEFHKASDYLRAKAQVATESGLECVFTVLVGEASDHIIEASKSARTLVMASHGKSHFDSFVLGSVATKVVRGSHCPVLLVRDRPIRVEDIKRIMVPLDDFELSKTALPEAQRLCKIFGATLVLTRVSEPIGFEFGLLDREEEGARLQEALREVADTLDRSVVVETAHGFGSAARVLLKQIREDNIDLVVLSSHGRSGFNRLVCGSVTENLVRGAECPVLVVRPSEGD